MGERGRLEGRGDDDNLSEFTAPSEPKPPSFTGEQVKEMAEGWEKMERGEYPQQPELDKGEPLDPF
jgi:hypothetical protein